MQKMDGVSGVKKERKHVTSFKTIASEMVKLEDGLVKQTFQGFLKLALVES